MEHGEGADRIVVGIDGSPPSLLALRWAAEEAALRGGVLEVVHAWRVPYAVHPNTQHVDAERFRDESEKVLAAAVDSLAGLEPSPSEIRPRLVEDDAAGALLDAAVSAALLVVGSRGHGGFVGLLIGSVSQRCVDHAPCPVAVVPPSWEGPPAGRVVVGVDGSQPSYDALHWAVAEAGRRGATLDVVNGYGFHQYVSPFGPSIMFEPDELERTSRKMLEEMSAGAVGAADRGPRGVELIASSMNAVPALLQVADGADLLVVGSRGHGTIRGMLTGSVSQQCVHHAPCPVVVVRHREPEHDADG
jgi:nucleotide-binding universal stress UspA family protein